MLNRYLVIDNFYDEPNKLVDVARDSLNGEVLRGNFAGVMTPKAYLGLQQRDLFQTLLNEPSIDSSTELNGKIRFSKENDTFAQNIHFDGGLKTNWSGVIYLSKEHPKVDGTSFWRHLGTGLEEIPRSIEGLAKHGLKSKQDIKNFLEVDGIDNSLWEKTLTIPYKYNRLVLFRPWLFHSPGESFGNTLESSRIVQTLFLGN
jgi:hypothetical protein